MRRFQQDRHALGSDAILTILVEDEAIATKTFDALWSMITAFEQRFSRFLPDSELSNFNANAGKPKKISDAFRALLFTAKDMAEKADGLYNPFILPALQRAGYKGSWPTPNDSDERLNYEARTVATWQDIVVSGNTARIPKDSALDFGGIGKGYLLDELAHWLRRENIPYFCLSLGGDIICSGFDLGQKPWSVGIQKALEPNETVASITNETGALMAVATSGVTKRKGETANGAWHHIIDPRTGMPAETNVLTATVCADDATTADVLAKCLVINKDNIEAYKLDGTLLQWRDAKGIVQIHKTGKLWSK